MSSSPLTCGLDLAAQAVQRRIKEFLSEAVEIHGAAGITADLLVPPNRFHLTLCTLKLLSPHEVARAQDVLESSAPDLRAIVGQSTPPLRLRGLQIMNDDPSQVHETRFRIAQRRLMAVL